MEMVNLHTELERREIVLEMDGLKLVAIDPYNRLSPALDEAIRTHRETLASELKPVSAALRPLRDAVAAALVATDLDPVIDDTDAAYRRREITQEEAEYIARTAMERARQIPATIEEMPLSDFARSGLVREVESKTLGETVLWAADNVKVEMQPGRVVYRASELKELVGVTPEHLQRIHLVKQRLNGEVISNKEDSQNGKDPSSTW